MADALGAAETRALLARHGLRPRTTLGQHFIIDPNTIRRIVSDAEVGPGNLVIEIGPGLGTLTRALAATGADVLAIERDRGLAPVLEETVGSLSNVEVVFADAMRFDLAQALDARPRPAPVVVANLPYQIATGLVLSILEEEPRVRRLDVMMQKEAGERLVAAPGDQGYGAVSVKVAALAVARISFRVSRSVFLPIPDVDNVIVRLDRRERLAASAERAELWRVIDAGFAQRRKTLRRALRGAGFDAGAIVDALAATRIDGGVRAEELGLAEFDRLAQQLVPGA